MKPAGGRRTGPEATDEALLLIERGQLRVLGLLPRASNHVFLAEVSDGEGRALAVYKPRRGEAPLWDFPEGTLCRREVAAYVLARALGWPRVPPTVLREGPHGLGSVQLFVQFDPRQHFFTLRDRFPLEFRAVAAFDVVANNADRKAGHCLLGEDRQVWVVDHGVCFNVEPKLRTVIWDFAGEPLPVGLRRDVARVAEGLRSGPLRAELLQLLSPEEVDATAHRAENLAALGRFPEPPAARPYPWPPV